MYLLGLFWRFYSCICTVVWMDDGYEKAIGELYMEAYKSLVMTAIERSRPWQLWLAIFIAMLPFALVYNVIELMINDLRKEKLAPEEN